ncbi:MAG: restriction endonuclease subunit S [Ruminococcus sp.]|nr:restriction endonuclease subunit S [Ruminococcus sp.]
MKKTIDDCFFQIQNGANIKQGDVDGGFPITRIETTANDKFNRDRMGYAGITDISKYESYVLEDGDLLMSHINSVQYLGRTVLYVKQTDETIIHGMNLLRLKARRDVINPAYARYCFYGCPFRRQVRKITKKSVNQASFAVKDLKQIKIDVPSLSEQEQIVEVLDKLQKIIEIRSNELSTLDNLIKARFVEMFGDENNSKNWDVVNVEEVADVQVGVVIKPSQYYTDKSEGVRTFRSLNIGAGFIKDIDWVYFTKEGHQKNSKSILKKDDLLIVRSGAPGTACVVTEEYAGCNAVDIIIAHPDCKKVNPYYLCTFTNMPHGKKQIDEGIGGAAQQHFNVGKYNKLQLMLPPKTLQDEFVGFVKQVNKSKVVVSNTLYYN